MELDPSLERMRALLSSYYGVQDDTDTSQVDDAKDIDCATFDSVRAAACEAFSNAVGHSRCVDPCRLHTSRIC